MDLTWVKTIEILMVAKLLLHQLKTNLISAGHAEIKHANYFLIYLISFYL
jgi:hypothetical protein